MALIETTKKEGCPFSMHSLSLSLYTVCSITLPIQPRSFKPVPMSWNFQPEHTEHLNMGLFLCFIPPIFTFVRAIFLGPAMIQHCYQRIVTTTCPFILGSHFTPLSSEGSAHKEIDALIPMLFQKLLNHSFKTAVMVSFLD